MSHPLDPRLMAVLVCPACHGELNVDQRGSEQFLACSTESCGLRFPVVDGIPVLLVDPEADRVDGG